jgi:hypothetical protein
MRQQECVTATRIEDRGIRYRQSETCEIGMSNEPPLKKVCCVGRLYAEALLESELSKLTFLSENNRK